jgi:hypothetical protein
MILELAVKPPLDCSLVMHFCIPGPRDNTPQRGVIHWYEWIMCSLAIPTPERTFRSQ